jgi:hypothetical protein
MTDAEFAQWLNDEVEANRITGGQRDDLLSQKALFENQRTLIEQSYRNQIVGFVGGIMQVALDIHVLLESSKSQFPGRTIYFEPIGFHLL